MMLGVGALKKLVIIATSVSLLSVVGAFLFLHNASFPHSYAAMHKMHHGQSSSHSGSHSEGHVHDEANMPGLRGKDTTPEEVSDLRTIFQQHPSIERTVSNLPNGITTFTGSANTEVQDAIVSHVSMMVTRLAEGRNPEVIIQSPTLDALFDFHDEIETEIERTNDGVKVVQTSENPEVVFLLQAHAAEVSDMSLRGMVAVHERMTRTEN
jgi:hypothetical protein